MLDTGYQSQREGVWSSNKFGGLILIFIHIFKQFPITMLSVTLYLLILAPGVIQLTQLDDRSIERQIMQLARDPRYSTVLTVRSGVNTRSTGASDGTQLINRDPAQPAAQVSSQSGQPATPQASGDGATGAPVLPIIPCIPWVNRC